MQLSLHGKLYFLFPDVLKRRFFQKNCAGIWSFLYCWERLYFFFPKIWSYPQTENERWSFSKNKKNTRKYDIYFKCSEKMIFSKKITPGHDLSWTIWKIGIFSRKHGIFCLDEKRERGDLSQEMHGNMIFFIWYVPRPPAKKKLKTFLSRKNTPKGDWHSGSTPHKGLQKLSVPSWNLYRCFHILLSSKKNPGNLIYWIEVWFLLQFISLEIFYNE